MVATKREKERERRNLEERGTETYDVIKMEANRVGGAAKAKDQHFVNGVPDDRVHLLLLPERRHEETHVSLVSSLSAAPPAHTLKEQGQNRN